MDTNPKTNTEFNLPQKRHYAQHEIIEGDKSLSKNWFWVMRGGFAATKDVFAGISLTSFILQTDARVGIKRNCQRGGVVVRAEVGLG